jgi:hypothetical protein
LWRKLVRSRSGCPLFPIKSDAPESNKRLDGRNPAPNSQAAYNKAYEQQQSSRPTSPAASAINRSSTFALFVEISKERTVIKNQIREKTEREELEVMDER